MRLPLAVCVPSAGTNLNEKRRPSPSVKYARDWTDAAGGVGLLPKAGDEFLIVRNYGGSTQDHVRMVLSRWCAGASWYVRNAGECGGQGAYPGYGAGEIYRRDIGEI